MLEFIEHLDRQLFLLINGWHSTVGDRLMSFISGKWEWLPLYLLLLFFVIRKERKLWWLSVLSIALVIGLADQLSVHAFKEVFQRYRPCHNLEIQSMVHLVNNHCGGKYGFVSSHASNSFAVVTFLHFFFRKRWASFTLLFWALLICYSRIYLGVHYPADVVGGAVLGILIGSFIYYLNRKVKEKLG